MSALVLCRDDAYNYSVIDMNMKIAFTIIFLSALSLASYSQDIDTIVFWDKFQLVTDVSLNDNGNCIRVDTLVGFHACNNYNGEEISLAYYEIDQEFCDSIKTISDENKQNHALSKYRFNLPPSKVKFIRLIPDNYWNNDLYYSPEILFKIKLDKKEYPFNSIVTSYKIDEKELVNGISILERIPNASKLFGKLKLEVIVFIGHKTHKLMSIEDLERWHFPTTNYERIKKVQVIISNNCGDDLQMNFDVSINPK